MSDENKLDFASRRDDTAIFDRSLPKIRDFTTVQTTSLTTGTETTILTAETGIYHDMVLITCHNDSDAAVSVSIREATAGDVKFIMTIPAAGSQLEPMRFPIPYPQAIVGANWTADQPDTTNTTITILAEAVKNK